MIRSWSVAGLLRDLEGRGRHPAFIAFRAADSETWESATVADKVLRLARGLKAAGAGDGCRVALWAPNSPIWIIAALGVLSAGGVVVPIDDLADAVQFDAALASSAARLVFTTERYLETSRDILAKHSVRTILVDAPEGAGQYGAGWQALLGEQVEDLTLSGNDEPAFLSWTSGTTGSPKAFLLTHGNIATNVEALQQMNVVGQTDRALLPLPLHNAYPFIVGIAEGSDDRDRRRPAGRKNRSSADAGNA